MTLFRMLSLALLAAALSASACGKRGDPIRPGQESPDDKEGIEELF